MTEGSVSSPAQPAGRIRRVGRQLLHSRHGGVLVFGAVFLGVALATRLALLLKAAHEVTWNPSLLAGRSPPPTCSPTAGWRSASARVT